MDTFAALIVGASDPIPRCRCVRGDYEDRGQLYLRIVIRAAFFPPMCERRKISEVPVLACSCELMVDEESNMRRWKAFDDVRKHHGREHEHLREIGTRVRADVDAVEFLDTWHGDSPLFSVTVSYQTPSGRKSSTGRMISSIPGAPIVGGTIQLWFSDDGADTASVYMEEDSESILDPDAEITYRLPGIS